MVNDILVQIEKLRIDYYEEYLMLPNFVVLHPTMITLIESYFLSYATRYVALSEPYSKGNTLYGMEIIPSPKVKDLLKIEVY